MTLWQKAIIEELRNCRIAFKTYEGDPNKLKLQGYEQITGHLVFDIRLSENFRRKARFVADGHKTSAPAAITYSTIVSRDSIRIILMIATLNDFDIFGADIQNAFVCAPN